MKVLADIANKRDGILNYIASLSYLLVDKKIITIKEMEDIIKNIERLPN